MLILTRPHWVIYIRHHNTHIKVCPKSHLATLGCWSTALCLFFLHIHINIDKNHAKTMHSHMAPTNLSCEQTRARAGFGEPPANHGVMALGLCFRNACLGLDAARRQRLAAAVVIPTPLCVGCRTASCASSLHEPCCSLKFPASGSNRTSTRQPMEQKIVCQTTPYHSKQKKKKKITTLSCPPVHSFWTKHGSKKGMAHSPLCLSSRVWHLDQRKLKITNSKNSQISVNHLLNPSAKPPNIDQIHKPWLEELQSVRYRIITLQSEHRTKQSPSRETNNQTTPLICSSAENHWQVHHDQSQGFSPPPPLLFPRERRQRRTPKDRNKYRKSLCSKRKNK